MIVGFKFCTESAWGQDVQPTLRTTLLFSLPGNTGKRTTAVFNTVPKLAQEELEKITLLNVKHFSALGSVRQSSYINMHKILFGVLSHISQNHCSDPYSGQAL